MTEPSTMQGPKWYTKRWVQLVAVGVIGLGIGGVGGSGDASKQADLAKAAEERAAAAEARIAAAEENAQTAMTEAADAKADAQKEIQAQLQAIAEQKSALAARERAVSGAEAEARANTFDGDGVYLVGSDIRAGTYKSAGGENCYWARHNKANDILDNHLGSGPTVVVIRSSDFSLEVTRCAPFTRTSS